MNLLSQASNFLNTQIGGKSKVGIGGFTADVRVNETIQLTSDVPDNYVEDGSVINDHIINTPTIISIDGEVSDIHIKPNIVDTSISKPFDKISGIALKLFPSAKTAQMVQKVNRITSAVSSAVDTANSFLDAGQDIFNVFSGNSSDPQQAFFDFIDKIYYSKQLISIETPFKTYDNMRITSLTITRDNTTNQALKYKISAKEVRFAKTLTASLADTKYFLKKKSKGVAKSAKNKVSEKKQKGTVNGVEKSFLSTILG